MKRIISIILVVAMLMPLFCVKIDAEGEIFEIAPEREELNSEGGKVSFVLKTRGINSANFFVEGILNGEKVILPFTITGEKAKKTVVVTFPKNEEFEDKIYEVNFNPDKTDASSVVKKATVTVKAAERKDVVVSEFLTTDNNISLEGKVVSITIKGKNLDLGMFTIKTFVKNGTNLEPRKLSKTKFEGFDTLKTASLTIPKVDKDTTYVVELYEKGEKISSLEIVQNSHVEDLKYMPFISQRTYLAGNEIFMEYARPVFEVIPGTLKQNILIDFDGKGNFGQLNEDDSVRIEGSNIIITLNSKLPVWDGAYVPKVSIKKGAIKNDNGEANDGSQKNRISKDGTPIVNDAKFIKGYVLENEGGEVEIEIYGANLDQNKTKVKILRNTKIELDENKKDKREMDLASLNYSLLGSGEKQTIKFTAPKNETDTTKTYIVMVAVDGVKYSTDLASSVSARKRKLVVAVLPKGMDKTARTLSFMTIQSYGTQGGNEKVPDNTYTVPPAGQGSKKTLVHAYGTNLVSAETKIRFKDENGVYWYPSHNAVFDSSDRFIMIMLDNHTGITGGGNNLLLEVILPKEYNQDMTYTYEIAIDGVHYNEVTTVRAFMPNSKANQVAKRPTISELQKDVEVKHVDEEGNPIGENVDKTYKIMKTLPFNLTQVGMEEPQAIPGYEYVYIDGIESKHAKEREEYKALIAKSKNGDLTDEELQNLIRLRLILKTAQNEEFESVLGDKTELKFVYRKLVDEKKSHLIKYEVKPDPTYAGVDFQNEKGESISKAVKGEKVVVNVIPVKGKSVKSIKLDAGTVKKLDVKNNMATFTMPDMEVKVTVIMQDLNEKPEIGDREVLPGSEFSINPNENEYFKVSIFGLLEEVVGEKYYWVKKGHKLTMDDLKDSDIKILSEKLKGKVVVGWTNKPIGETKNELPIIVDKNISLYPVFGDKTEEPTKPVEPEKPIEPEKPEEPTKPVEPTPTPEEPTVPVFPDYPSVPYRPRPNKPVTPTKDIVKDTTKPAETTKPTETVKPVEEKKDYGIVETIPTIAATFSDLPENEAAGSIMNMVARGILKGMDNGKFEGELPITRAMVATVLKRLSKDQTINDVQNFKDVKDKDCFAEAVKWAQTQGLIKGYEDGTFKANKLVTRQELAIIIERFLKNCGIKMDEVKELSYQDLDTLPAWSRDAIVAMAKIGLVEGETTEKYNPTSEFTREELAVMLEKIIEWVEKH